MAMRAWQCGPFLHLGGARRGQDAPGAGARPRAAARRRRAPRRRRLPDDAADAPVGRGGRAARACTSLPDATELRPPRDFHGVAVTYARVASAASRWARQCSAGDARHRRRGPPPRRGARVGRGLRGGVRGGRPLAAAVGHAVSLATPRRSRACATTTASPCPTSPTPTPTRCATAICRPVTFVPYDGVLQWRSGDDVVEASFGDALAGREAARRYRTAISTELPDGLPRILAAAHERLRARARRRPPRRRRARRRRRRQPRPGDRRVAARGHRRGAASSSCTPRRARPRSSPPSPARPTPGSSP